MTEPATIAPPGTIGIAVSAAWRGWTLALLTVICGINQLDRGIVAILLESIKREMHLSDAALGLMTGLGFSIVYALASFPIGRLADRFSRLRIISVGVIFYSIGAGVMGFAHSMTQLIAARSAVALGEATGNAPSAALISDLYPAARRTRMMAIWSAGSYLGLFVGLTMGGWINDHYGWRVALWSISAPGIAIGLLTLFTGREGRGPSQGERRDAPPLGATLATLWSTPNYRWTLAAMVFGGMTVFSVQVWTPSILARAHGMDSTAIGFFAGFFKGVLGLCGILAGGFVAQSLAARRAEALAIVPIVSSLLVPPALFVFLLSGNMTISLAGLGLASFLLPAYQPPALTMVHAVIEPEMRALATTIVLASLTLAGLGFGPLIVGSLSDFLKPRFGAASLQYALLLPAMLPLLTAFCFRRASLTVAAEAVE